MYHDGWRWRIWRNSSFKTVVEIFGRSHQLSVLICNYWSENVIESSSMFLIIIIIVIIIIINIIIGYLKDLPIYQTSILLHIMMMSPHECTIAIVLWLLYSVHTVHTVHNHLTVQNASGHAASGSSRHQQLPPFPRWNILGFWDYEIFWMRSNIFHLSKIYGFRITHF